jgi:hypothetical protein
MIRCKEAVVTEEPEAMSQALPYWDDALELHLHLQSPEPQQTYTKEEAQELVEMAYQEGWQQGNGRGI